MNKYELYLAMANFPEPLTIEAGSVEFNSGTVVFYENADSTGSPLAVFSRECVIGYKKV